MWKITFHISLNIDMYIYNSLSLIQYPEGMTFPLSMPPNMILLNSFNIYDYKSEDNPLKERQYN